LLPLKNQSFPARLRFALAGIAHALRTERSLRTQAAVLLAVLLAMLWLRPEPIWWALVSLASAGVLAAELLNTALEQLADRLHPELHEQVRIAKDCAAGGVLLASLGAVAVAVALVVHLLGKP
jgi:diacylglycerol kinase (ATP)